MAKRFVDTGRWGKVWFRKLGSQGRDVWNFITDNCDAAGVWEIDLEEGLSARGDAAQRCRGDLSGRGRDRAA